MTSDLEDDEDDSDLSSDDESADSGVIDGAAADANDAGDVTAAADAPPESSDVTSADATSANDVSVAAHVVNAVDGKISDVSPAADTGSVARQVADSDIAPSVAPVAGAEAAALQADSEVASMQSRQDANEHEPAVGVDMDQTESETVKEGMTEIFKLTATIEGEDAAEAEEVHSGAKQNESETETGSAIQLRLQCKHCDFVAFSKSQKESHERWHDSSVGRDQDDATSDIESRALQCPFCPCAVRRLSDFSFHLQFHQQDSKVCKR